MRKPGTTLGFVLAGFAFFTTMLGTTLPTPLYPIYQRRFGIEPVLIPVIFAVYALGVIAGLLFFGHQSDRVGRRRVLLPGLALSGLSAIAFLFAQGLPEIFLGRILSGLSAGAFTGTGTAAMVDLLPEERRREATLLAVVANLGGLAFGTLTSGLLAQYVSMPLRVPFAVDALLVIVAAAGMLAVPETIASTDRRLRLQFQQLRVPREIRSMFVRSAIAGICGFAVSGVFGAVAPELLVSQLHVNAPAITGALVFLLFGMSCVGQLTVNRLPKRWALAIGCALLLVGLGFLAAAITERSLALAFLSATFCGAGQGLAIGFGLADINERITERRGEVTSTYFVLIYAGLAFPVIGVGLLAMPLGLPLAGLVFCGVVGLTVASVIVSLARMRDQEPPRTEQ